MPVGYISKYLELGRGKEDEEVQTISSAIMPPMDTPRMWSCRSEVQPMWSRTSRRSLAISLVEYRMIGLSERPTPVWP